MRKTKIGCWVFGLDWGKSKYKINNVNFIVESRFEDPNSDTTINNRFGRAITSDFIPLTDMSEYCKMADEYVCLAAAKED